ncbi:hypothetical protein E1263_33070 [Kribbella antibiotica]|uniref:Uncharacterized protein n=1 Tax=Kribbella antibiotica TaxID=190195 RepID=A0A4R4YTR3_9ACTN|nr:hypothetical protein [Kribbella antibiotica]TDD48738.1 hypothetical protein E1263_33070 [Kribbella antibiotica]
MQTRPGLVALASTGRWAKYAPILIVAVLLTSGLLGRRYVRDLVAHLGTAVSHNELALRALGWAWVGVPLVVLTVLLVLRRRIDRTIRGVVATAALCLAASSAMLTGGRRAPRAEVFFGAVYPDAQPLSYGWAAAGLTIFAMLAVSAITLIVAGKIAGRPMPAAVQQKVGHALGVALILLLAAGLLLALTGPLPS